jgi:hypothetical protein
MALPTSLLKKPVDLSGTSPEDEEYKADFKKSQADLRAALAARENQLFDPVLLALSQGFAASTKSGSFGESLSNAAGLASQAAIGQQKNAAENAQMRMQLAQMGLEQSNKERAMGMVGNLFPKPAIAPTAGAPAVGAPVGGVAGAEGAPPVVPPAQGMRTISSEDIFKITVANKDVGDALSKAVQADRERFKISQNGIVFDSGTGQYLNIPIPGQTQSKFDTPYGSFNMTANEYAQLGQAMSKGKGREWMDMWRQGKIDVAGNPVAGAVPSPVGAPPPAGAPAGAPSPNIVGRQTVSDADTAAAARKIEAEGTARNRVEQTKEVKDSAKAAMSLIPLYDRADKLLKTRGIETALGVLEKPDFLAQIGTVADEGIKVGPYAINAPSVRKIVTNFAQDQNVINALTELGQVEAMWQFLQRKGLGSGTSVSNFEQQMVNAMGPNFKDPKDAYTKKLQFMREKAYFEQKLGQELFRTGKQYEDYVNSSDFDRIFGDYRTRLERIGEVRVPNVGGPVNPAAGPSLRQQIGIPKP